MADMLAALLAFLLYLGLASALAFGGRLLAGPPRPTLLKTSTYASGEAPPARPAAPGYRPFFTIALFFAMLHLGALMLGSLGPSPVAGLYLIGLLLVLIAAMLG